MCSDGANSIREEDKLLRKLKVGNSLSSIPKQFIVPSRVMNSTSLKNKARDTYGILENII